MSWSRQMSGVTQTCTRPALGDFSGSGHTRSSSGCSSPWWFVCRFPSSSELRGDGRIQNGSGAPQHSEAALWQVRRRHMMPTPRCRTIERVQRWVTGPVLPRLIPDVSGSCVAEQVKRGISPFLRCAALFFSCLTGVRPPEELFSAPGG